MSNYHLLLLAGDGIGPEVMAEVKKLIELFNKKGIATILLRGGAGRRRLLRRRQGLDHRRHHGEGGSRGRRDFRRGRRPAMGQGAL